MGYGNNKRSLESRLKLLLKHRRRLAWAIAGIVVVAAFGWAQITTIGALTTRSDELKICRDLWAGTITDREAMEVTAASLAGKLQFAQDSLGRARKDLEVVRGELRTLWRQVDAIADDLEEARTRTSGLEGELKNEQHENVGLADEIERMLGQPADTLKITITETLPPDTISIRTDSWLPTKKGWAQIATGFLVGFVARSLLESDDTQTIHIEREN